MLAKTSISCLLAFALARAPARYRVRLETSKGPIVIEVNRAQAPRAADRFHALVTSGYYDDTRFYRVIKGKWAQFGISGNPEVARRWRKDTIADEDPAPGSRRKSNARGAVAFAFAEPNGRTTQVFISLSDNSALDAQGFIPFGRVVEGMEVADALDTEYGEESGGGIRGGRQQPLFEGGNAWLDQHFPRLDKLLRARVQRR